MRQPQPGGIRGLAMRVGNAFKALAGGSSLPAWDDYWYSRPGWDSAAGMSVTPESAMKLSAVFACVRVRSETLATCPLIIYKRLPNGGKVRAPEHPLYHVLHNSPNQWQTSVEYIEMTQAHLDLRGNAFSRILPGPRGAIDQLIPIHPDLVDVYRLENGRLKYRVRSRFTAEVDWYAQEDIFHLRGLSSDGLVGLSPIAVQRETMGSALGMQDYAARFFANDATSSTWLKHPGRFKDDAARDKFRENWQKSQTGSNRHKTAVLEDGMELKALGLSNKDSQFLEAYLASREEVCSIFRVPPHKIAILQRATNNNIEHQGIEFVTDCVQPMATRWERRINSDLIEPTSGAFDGAEYFAEFSVGGLLRGDLKSRYDAYAIGRNWGWICPNDVCNFEGMNPIPEEKGGNEYLRPLNMVPAGTVFLPAGSADAPDQLDKPTPGNDNSQQDPPPDSPDDEGADAMHKVSLLQVFANAAAKRVVGKEVSMLRKMLARHCSKQFDAGAFTVEARTFYAAHQSFVSETMCLSSNVAQKYVEMNLKLLLHSGNPVAKTDALDVIEDDAPEWLAKQALGSRVAQETMTK
jgi:HK97 family phage portal protein